MLGTLDMLNVGECGIVSKVLGKGDIRRRLLDIGLVEGQLIECIMISPLGDPKAYWIKGALIALRNEDAANILIDEVVE